MCHSPNTLMGGHTESTAQQGSSPGASKSIVLFELYSIGLIDEVIGHETQSPAPLPSLGVGLISGWLKALKSNHIVGLSSMASSHPKHFP